MSKRWENVPVRREIRKALMEWANWDRFFGESCGPPRQDSELGKCLEGAARQFREDVLAEPDDEGGTQIESKRL